MKTTKFKPSEVGLIPVEWEVKRLGDIADFVTATTPLATIDLRWYIGTENMIADKAGVIQNDAEVPYKAVREYLKGDVLISNIRPYLKKIWLADRDGGCSTDVLVIRTHDCSICIPEFLAMLLSDDSFFAFAMANAVGTKMPRGDKNVLMNFQITLPSIPEQKAIAEALSDMDALLAAMTTLIEKKRAIKQGAMQDLLTGKKRLAGFAGKWIEKRLGEIADFVTATTPTATIDLKWYIGTENMLAEKVGVIQNDAEVPYKAVREYLKGDVLVSNIRPYLKKIWLADCDGGCSTDVLVIRTHDRSICIPEFLVMLISDDAFFDFAMSNAVGTKMPRGDKKVLVNFGVKLPTLAEQKAIAAVLSDMDAEIAALEAKRAKYERIKQGMMQELLTGKTRLLPSACTRADAGRCGPTRGTCGG